ncbi:family 4 glycosyl hydrolase [Amedibacillus sp. YH-ame6]
MKKYTVAIIGSGSAYTPGIVNSLLEQRGRIPLKKIVFIDDHEERLHITGDFMGIMVKEVDPSIEVCMTTKREEGFVGMDFLLAQIRTGMLPQRVQDEKIAMKHGVIGQETCGPGGFAFAMREIPAMVEIAKDVVKYAPNAWIINYSNPTAIVAEAIQRAVPEVRNICICDVPPWQQSDMAKIMKGTTKDFSYRYFGLNHLGWFTNMFDVFGVDKLPELSEYVKVNGMFTGSATDESWARTAKRQKQFVEHFPGTLPVSYLQYYYYPDEMFEDEDINYTRGEYCIDHREKETFALCLEGVKKGSAKGNDLTDTIHGDFIVNIVNAIVNDTNEEFIINVPNDGVISNFTQGAIIECIATINASGYRPYNVGTIPTFQKGLMEVMKAYETLTVEACLEGSYQKALEALTLNPIVPSTHVAKAILDDYIDANKAYWPELK